MIIKEKVINGLNKTFSKIFQINVMDNDMKYH
jgi:hypothetical protein